MVKMGLGLSENSNYGRNVPIMVKMRGQSTSDDFTIADIRHFPYIYRDFIQFLAKMAIFEGDNGIEAVQYFKLQWKCANFG